MESEGAITARFYVQITRFLIWEIIVQRASFRLILRGNAGKKKERFLFLYFFFSVFSSSTPCWDWCFHPHFLPSYTLLFRCAFVFISRLFWKEGKVEKKWYRYMLLAYGGEGEGLKVGHWPNGGSFPLDWLSYTPIHSARNAQVELQLSSRLHVFFFSYCDPFLLSCVRLTILVSLPSTSSSAKWHSETRHVLNWTNPATVIITRALVYFFSSPNCLASFHSRVPFVFLGLFGQENLTLRLNGLLQEIFWFLAWVTICIACDYSRGIIAVIF